MPELPEVETTLRGLQEHLQGARIQRILLRREHLRWAIPPEIQRLAGEQIRSLERRAKYLLMHTDAGSAIWHLGMSGNLRIVQPDALPKLHDHVDWELDHGGILRFHDPRRFGCLLYQAPEQSHPLLAELGPEPLADARFDASYLFALSRGRKQAVKHFLMDQKTVVGVGNIYAAESLFKAKVRPQRAAGSLSRIECQRLVTAIKSILHTAIERGGTTLRDFIQPDGAPGYFAQELFVYGRLGEACRVCASTIKAADLGPRQSYFCPTCQR